MVSYAMFGGRIPFVNNEYAEYPIVGEVYEVNKVQLSNLDRLEGHPDWYRREPIKVIFDENQEVVEADIYFNDYDKDMFPTGDYAERT
jgi:gamma-glutamylcyclotransferase (GGCT)/AIG2-like uncharacterized protein YtfP